MQGRSLKALADQVAGAGLVALTAEADDALQHADQRRVLRFGASGVGRAVDAGLAAVGLQRGECELTRVAELRQARALWKKEAAPTAADTGRTAFKTLKGSATIKDGVLNNPDFVMEMGYLRVNGSGTLDLASQKLDYKLQTHLYKIPPEGAGSEMQDLKAAEIPVRVSGTLADMKVRPDFDALVKAETKQKVQETQKELTDKLKDKLGKWLGGDKKD